MRRRYSGRSEGFVRSEQGEQGFWPSYADMMSAVALILFFLMLLSYIQNLITGNNLQNTQETLENTRARLLSTEEKLASTELELKDTEDTLALTRKEVEKAENELAKLTIDLDEAKLTLSQQEKDLAAQDKLLADQKALIADQEEYMKAASEELLAMRGQMQTVAVLRLSILEQIRDSMAKVMGSEDKVTIGENGNIVLDESVLFDSGSSEIKDEARPALDQLVKVFLTFLANDENARYVDSVVISGHTDSEGTDESNRILSTDRANSVLNYLMSAQNRRLEKYASFFCASGYGETRPVQSNATPEGRAANRRIEISIILKDDSIMDILESYLDIDVPASVTATAGKNGSNGTRP